MKKITLLVLGVSILASCAFATEEMKYNDMKMSGDRMMNQDIQTIDYEKVHKDIKIPDDKKMKNDMHKEIKKSDEKIVEKEEKWNDKLKKYFN